MCSFFTSFLTTNCEKTNDKFHYLTPLIVRIEKEISNFYSVK